MQEICAEARISPGALYRYFDSKADIIAAIAEEKQREGEAAFVLARAHGGFVNAMAAVFDSVLERRLAETNGPIFADILGEASRDPLLAERLSEIYEANLAGLAEAIEQAQADGEIDPAIEPQGAARMLIAVFEGMAMRASLQRGDNATLLRQFRTLAERYLAPAAGLPTYPAVRGHIEGLT